MSIDAPLNLKHALVELLTSYHELNTSFVEERFGMPTSLQFLQCVQKNRPVVFRGAASHWKAVQTWDPEYLRMKMGETTIAVAETPFGNADSAVISENDGRMYFVKPHQTNMQFSDFLDQLHMQKANLKSPVVRYAQSQDDNLQREFGPIESDVERHILWASEALDRLPDAVNVWMGNERSVSATHKDPYENLYVQITGSKRFVLISPFEGLCLQEETLPSANYVPGDTDGLFDILPDEPENFVHFWPTVDPDSPKNVDRAWWDHCKPLHVELNPGDILYLPAMWYHKVSQCTDSDKWLCSAVNYWYDMEYAGPFYPSINFIRSVARIPSDSGTDKSYEP
ncbi:phospholipase A2 [Pyronema omphalodes]|nr:phospholipase A2 [Pyronema omphalodes]